MGQSPAFALSRRFMQRFFKVAVNSRSCSAAMSRARSARASSARSSSVMKLRHSAGSLAMKFMGHGYHERVNLYTF